MDIDKKLKEIVPSSISALIIEREEVSLKEYYGIEEEKKRNLIINLTKYIIKSSKSQKEITLTKKEIRENILFKEIDYKIYKDEFFEEKGIEEYSIKKDIKEEIEKYKTEYNKFKDSSGETEFNEFYLEMKEMISLRNLNYDNYNKKINLAKEIAKELHWKYLPIYDETIMKNRKCTPEKNIDTYYDHYHTLEDLYEAIQGKEIKLKDKNGDNSLNKEIDFEVYTSRWNSFDVYKIKRTIFGWSTSHVSNNGDSIKNGEGAFLDSLNHDSIFYPVDGVQFALEILWNEADNNKIDFNELKIKLQSIADWISDVERNMRRKQPEWCNYY